MSATDELRRMLDERGVEWGTGFGGDTLWTGKHGIEWRWDKQEGILVMYSHAITPEQAIAATLGSGTLTAEQVRKAIFDSSSYASYDGAKYYADGIGMQAIADELNSRAERTCEWTLKERWPNRTGDDHVYGYETSCGVRHTWWPDSLPNYCPTCGGEVKAVKR